LRSLVHARTWRRVSVTKTTAERHRLMSPLYRIIQVVPISPPQSAMKVCDIKPHRLANDELYSEDSHATTSLEGLPE